MGQRLDLWLWLLQRGTAVLLALFVLIHLGTIIWATGAGLSAEAIVGRVAGNLPFLIFYALFVLAAALHGAVGLRAVLGDVLRTKGVVDAICLAFCALLLWLGWRAAFGLYGLGAGA